MYNYEFLHFVRAEEIKLIEKRFIKGKPILEVGGGTGYQAKILSDLGYDVTSIDLHDGYHAKNRVFPVQGYDGKTIPFTANSFEFVFTSHTLECVTDLDLLQNEIFRILSDSGVVIHLVSSNSWELWTTVSGFFDILPRLWHTASRLKNGYKIKEVFVDMLKGVFYWMFVWKRSIVGGRANHIITWRKRGWINKFKAASFEVVDFASVGIFFTGKTLFGFELPLKARRNLASSPVYLFLLKKQVQSGSVRIETDVLQPGCAGCT